MLKLVAEKPMTGKDTDLVMFQTFQGHVLLTGPQIATENGLSFASLPRLIKRESVTRDKPPKRSFMTDNTLDHNFVGFETVQ